jgi:hypothetical protein
MCVSNRQSLEVSYLHLGQREPMLAIWVADAPADMLEIFNGVAKQEVLKLYPAYEAGLYTLTRSVKAPGVAPRAHACTLACLNKARHALHGALEPLQPLTHTLTVSALGPIK